VHKKIASLTAREIMTRKIETLAPTTDLAAAVEAFVRRGYPVMPVVDDGKRLVGVFSQIDCVRTLSEALYEGFPSGHVADHMTRDVETLSPRDDVFAISTRFEAGCHRCFPVVDDGTLIGIVSTKDLLRALDRMLGEKQRGKPVSTYEILRERHER
jgi:CBS domain-containing protein